MGIVRLSRVVTAKNEWELHFTVAPRQRGQGIARPMIQKALEKFINKHQGSKIVAWVKARNKKSIFVLESLGFCYENKGNIVRGLVRLQISTKSLRRP